MTFGPGSKTRARSELSNLLQYHGLRESLCQVPQILRVPLHIAGLPPIRRDPEHSRKKGGRGPNVVSQTDLGDSNSEMLYNM